MEKQYKYNAFISYRHTEPDKFVAENLHKQLESYVLPKNLVKKRKGQKTKIERVFRDKEELPLTSNLEEPILEALHDSEWLIVVCSPRLRDSLWCKKEIETFIALRGREHVLAVLIEGEPATAFPEELLYEIKEVEQPDGTIEKVKIEKEPLAADFRGANKKEILKSMKTEVLRVIAAMFGVAYDDLRQRHRERKLRRIMFGSFAVGAVCLLFGVYSTVTALRIKEQKEKIEYQSEQIVLQSEEILRKNEEITKQNEEITKQNDEITKQNEELALHQAEYLTELAGQYLQDGRREDAVRSAVEALAFGDGSALPYTAEAQYILTESLNVYETGGVYKAGIRMEAMGRISFISESPDSGFFAVCDETGYVTLYDLKNRETIVTLGRNEIKNPSARTCTFLGKDRFAYVNPENQLCIYDLTENSIVKQLDTGFSFTVLADAEGKFLLTENLSGLFTIYDGNSFTKIGEVTKQRSKSFGEKCFLSSQGVLAMAYSWEDEEKNENETVYFVDVTTGRLLSEVFLGSKNTKEICFRGETAYILSGAYAEGYVDCDTYLTAVLPETGAVLWENMQQGYYPSGVFLSGYEAATDLLCITTNNMQLVNMETGTVTYVIAIDSRAVGVETYDSNNNFLVFLADGEMLVVNRDYNLCVDVSERFECISAVNEKIIYDPSGIAVMEKDSNIVTIYSTVRGPHMEEVSRQSKYQGEKKEKTGDEAAETVASYGLTRPELVNSLYYSADETLCMIKYWDNSLVIYDVEADKVLNTIEDAKLTQWCIGTDSKGYTFLLGYTGCYVLNEAMEPVAWMKDATDVDLEKRKVFIETDGICFESPIYDVEDLLKIAKEQISE